MSINLELQSLQHWDRRSSLYPPHHLGHEYGVPVEVKKGGIDIFEGTPLEVTHWKSQVNKYSSGHHSQASKKSVSIHDLDPSNPEPLQYPGSVDRELTGDFNYTGHERRKPVYGNTFRHNSLIKEGTFHVDEDPKRPGVYHEFRTVDSSNLFTQSAKRAAFLTALDATSAAEHLGMRIKRTKAESIRALSRKRLDTIARTLAIRDLKQFAGLF